MGMRFFLICPHDNITVIIIRVVFKLRTTCLNNTHTHTHQDQKFQKQGNIVRVLSSRLARWTTDGTSVKILCTTPGGAGEESLVFLRGRSRYDIVVACAISSGNGRPDETTNATMDTTIGKPSSTLARAQATNCFSL